MPKPPINYKRIPVLPETLRVIIERAQRKQGVVLKNIQAIDWLISDHERQEREITRLQRENARLREKLESRPVGDFAVSSNALPQVA